MGDTQSEQVDELRWENVTLDTGTTKIVDGASGWVRSGQMIAIMGPSGGGKTSLLNCLAGRDEPKGRVTGSILFNGRSRRDFDWLHLVGFVPQEDIMYERLSVDETIRFYAKVCAITNEERAIVDTKVNDLIYRFGLAKSRRQWIGDPDHRGVSGGERKRVAVACELVTDPKILFLDEPTSGLDAFNALSLVKALRRYAVDGNRAVVMSVHQPRLSLLELFDNVALMSEGRCVFFGPPREALAHFSRIGFPCPVTENPGDHFLDLLTVNCLSAETETASRARIQVIKDAAPAIIFPNGTFNELTSKTAPSFSWRKWGVVWNRLMKVTFRDHAALAAEILAVGLGLAFTSFVFFQLDDQVISGVRTTLGFLLFFCVFAQTASGNSILAIFRIERPILRQERYRGTYPLIVHYICRILIALLLRIPTYTVYCFMVYYITGLRTDGFNYFVVFWATTMAFLWLGTGIGLTISGLSYNHSVVNIINAMYSTLCLIFLGYLVLPSQITWILRWIQYISPPFYGFRAYAQNQYAGLPVLGYPNGGDEVLVLYELDGISTVACALAVFGFGCLFLFLGYFTMSRLTNPRLRFEKPSID